MLINQSNRLTVQLNDDLSVTFLEGVQTVYLNSYLYNEFVVRPKSKLTPLQTLWGTFANGPDFKTASKFTKPIMLAKRLVTASNSAHEVVVVKEDGDTNTETVVDAECPVEYYMQLPRVVVKNAGQWYFSLEVREIPDMDEPDKYTYLGTSRVEEFTVNNSLAGKGTHTPPNNMSVAALYATATDAAAEAKVDANKSKEYSEQSRKYAERAQQSAEESAQAAADAISDEVNRAKNAETALQLAIDGVVAESGASLSFTVDPSTFVLTVTLKNKAGTVLSTKSVDLPLESVVVNAKYDSETKSIVLALQNGNTVPVPVADLLVGLASTKYVDDAIREVEEKIPDGLFEIPYDLLNLGSTSTSTNKDASSFIYNNFDKIKKGAYFEHDNNFYTITYMRVIPNVTSDVVSLCFQRLTGIGYYDEYDLSVFNKGKYAVLYHYSTNLADTIICELPFDLTTLESESDGAWQVAGSIEEMKAKPSYFVVEAENGYRTNIFIDTVAEEVVGDYEDELVVLKFIYDTKRYTVKVSKNTAAVDINFLDLNAAGGGKQRYTHNLCFCTRGSGDRAYAYCVITTDRVLPFTSSNDIHNWLKSQGCSYNNTPTIPITGIVVDEFDEVCFPSALMLTYIGYEILGICYTKYYESAQYYQFDFSIVYDNVMEE